MPPLILGAPVIVYLVLGILYVRYIHPMTILSTLPSAGVWALPTMMLFHFYFSLVVLIDVAPLIGNVKKSGILLVDFAIGDERNDHLSAHDAVRRASALSLDQYDRYGSDAWRVPLMLGLGNGSEIRQPLCYAMVGSLIVSQALTLFTMPVIYICLVQLSDWVLSWRSAATKEEPFMASHSGSVAAFFGHRATQRAPSLPIWQLRSRFTAATCDQCRIN